MVTETGGPAHAERDFRRIDGAPRATVTSPATDTPTPAPLLPRRLPAVPHLRTPRDLLALQRAVGNRATQRLISRGPAAGDGVVQRRFKLIQPDHEDAYEYGWADDAANPPAPSPRYQWLGSFPGLAGLSHADLLVDLDTEQLVYTPNMFGKTRPKSWSPSLEDKHVQDHIKANFAARMRKREPAPSGDIGKMDFRFPAANGYLWYVGQPPAWFAPQKFPGVTVIPADPSTLEARWLEVQADRAKIELQHGVHQPYEGSYEAGRFLYLRIVATPLGQDIKPRDDRSRLTFGKRSIAPDQLDQGMLMELRAARELLDQSVPQPAGAEATFTGEARGEDRGSGQTAAMQGMNAAAYAAAVGLNVGDPTDWEWLHIRGARLGGVTGPLNLVAGTNAANSHMIPYEHGILALSRLASAEYPLHVRWSFQGHDRLGLAITIEWLAPNGLVKGDKMLTPGMRSGRASFNPLNGTIIDRAQRDAVWDLPIIPTPPTFQQWGASTAQ